MQSQTPVLDIQYLHGFQVRVLEKWKNLYVYYE